MSGENNKIGLNEKEANANSEKKPAWWLPSVYISIRATAWIAFPVIAALYIGDWLDHKFQAENKWLIVSVAAAFVISMTGLIHTTLSEWKKLSSHITKSADKGKKN